MKDINLYYRAFVAYRKLTINNKNSLNSRKYIRQANRDVDKLVAVKFQCVIEEDWVKAIEYGLEYVEKAVREERQFIRTSGEVVPIEKVKKVDRSSVVHLAKHSNLITHVPEGQDIIPDQIYMVEKLSDYAVYENRFLYMLLRYLQDFIALRLEKIRNKVTTYTANLYINKTIKLHNRNINFNVDFSDEILHDDFLYDEYRKIPLIDRIDICYHTVSALLQTPVMVETSKAPLIREPIVKTNVLKMNPNFMAAVALYEFVASYKKEGFTFAEVKNEFSPFNDVMGDEYAELVNITSYLSYKYGNNFSERLKKDYELEERKIEEERRLEFEEKVQKLKKRILESGIGYEEYIVTVENRNNQLNSQLVEFYSIKDKLEQYIEENKELHIELEEKNHLIELLNNKIDLLIESHKNEVESIIDEYDFKLSSLQNSYEKKILELSIMYEDQLFKLDEEYKNKIAELERIHKEEIERLINDYETRIKELVENYENKIQDLILEYEERIKKIISDYELKIENIVSEYESKIENIVSEYESKIESIVSGYEEKIIKLNNEYNELNNEFSRYKEEQKLIINDYEKKLNEAHNHIILLQEEKLVLNAKIHMLQGNNEKISKEIDFTSKENIDALEEEYKAFKSFFNRNWKSTKKQIRKEYLNFSKKNEDKKSEEIKDE